MIEERPILALDVDGVLIEGWPDKRWDTKLESDLGISRETLREHFFTPYWQEIVIGKNHMMPILEKVFVEQSIDTSPQAFVDYWMSHGAHLRHDVLDAARNWQSRTGGRLVLATNQEHIRASYLWEEVGLSQDFEMILASCTLGAPKPTSEFFTRADEKLGRRSATPIIFLDDSKANVAAASAHGWKAYHAKSPQHAAEILSQEKVKGSKGQEHQEATQQLAP